MMNDYEQACGLATSEAQLLAHCATRTFKAAPVEDALKVVPVVATMKGACRHTLADIDTNTQACVLPGGLVELQVQVKNVGTGVWPASNFTMELRADSYVFPYWEAHALKLLADTKEGEVATFAGLLKAPKFIGRFALSWVLTGACGDIKTEAGASITVKTPVETTCSDGVFCNGMERWIGGKCVAAPHDQCDDGEVCTLDSCDQESQRCTRVMDRITQACKVVPSCKVNEGDEECVPDCEGKTCGGDGCGGVCGPLEGACPNSQSCDAGACSVWSAAGSCADPYRLVAENVALVGHHSVDLDTSLGFQTSILTCNPTATSGQIMYHFEVPDDGKKYSVDLRVSNGHKDDTDLDLDTVLELRKGACYDDTENPWILTGENQNAWCSDDASPPGGVGSRVVTELTPGEYYVIVGGYSAITVGPCTLTATFTEGYTPRCLSRFCGTDGGGGQCGTCAAEEVCNEYFQCKPAADTDFCTVDRCDGGKRECGPDGCGGFCGPAGKNGTCPTGQLCQLADGVCGVFPVCNHEVPVCTGCTVNQFCGPDCKCHTNDEELPDLVIDVDRFRESVLYDEDYFDEFSCAVHEQCVEGTGLRKLLRFDTTTINQGLGSLDLEDPTRRPDEYQFSQCHNHFHFSGYAAYRLMNDDGDMIARGHKQGYCMEDSDRQTYLQGPDVPCQGQTDCEKPGISKGWTDTYGNSIDCQWIDITNVPDGEYWLEMELNVERRFLEVTTENNGAAIRVLINGKDVTVLPDSNAARRR